MVGGIEQQQQVGEIVAPHLCCGGLENIVSAQDAGEGLPQFAFERCVDQVLVRRRAVIRIRMGMPQEQDQIASLQIFFRVALHVHPGAALIDEVKGDLARDRQYRWPSCRKTEFSLPVSAGSAQTPGAATFLKKLKPQIS